MTRAGTAAVPGRILQASGSIQRFVREKRCDRSGTLRSVIWWSGVRWGHETIKAKLNKLIKGNVKRTTVCDENKEADE